MCILLEAQPSWREAHGPGRRSRVVVMAGMGATDKLQTLTVTNYSQLECSYN